MPGRLLNVYNPLSAIDHMSFSKIYENTRLHRNYRPLQKLIYHERDWNFCDNAVLLNIKVSLSENNRHTILCLFLIYHLTITSCVTTTNSTKAMSLPQIVRTLKSAVHTVGLWRLNK